jgi:hypothetical protein
MDGVMDESYAFRGASSAFRSNPSVACAMFLPLQRSSRLVAAAARQSPSPLRQKPSGSSPGGFCKLISQAFQFINHSVSFGYPAPLMLSSRFFRVVESGVGQLGMSLGPRNGSDKQFQSHHFLSELINLPD